MGVIMGVIVFEIWGLFLSGFVVVLNIIRD